MARGLSYKESGIIQIGIMILMNNDEFYIDQKKRRKQNAEP